MGAPAIAAEPWLMREKVTVPDKVFGYVPRPELMKRILPTDRRVTVLKAPGGFGKTTLLADACRELRGAGVMTAWLTLDTQIAPQILDTYLAFAFQEAGLEILDLLHGHEAREEPLEHRTALLVRAIERRAAPCVLVLDELERMDDGESLALLNYLVRWSPANLHLAMGCRELPAALDIASLVYSGRAEVWSVDDLRFSKAEIAQFFGSDLSRREVASLARESSGWPIALRILQNERNSAAEQRSGDAGEFAENWVESRMWRGLTDSERQLLLDVGLFEWADAALLDAVLEGADLKRQVEAIPVVSGLLESAGGAASDRWRLHPLIREHCARRRFRETPERFRLIHRRIARTLAQRAETVAAVRHATEARDAELVCEIFRGAGGLRWWLREGFVRLQAGDRFLTPEIMDAYPDLALAHCVVLIMSGQLDEARRTYVATAARLRESTQESSANPELELDDACVRGLLSLYGCDDLGSQTVRTLLADHERVCEISDVDPLMRANFELGLCIGHSLRAEFDAARDRAARAKRCLGENPYLGIFVDLQMGQVAMAEGRVTEAAACYAKALRTARASFLRDPGPNTFGEVLMRELDMERNRIAGIGNMDGLPRAFLKSGTPFASYAAAAGVAVDLTLQRKGVDAALATVEGMRDHARRVDLPALMRYLAALRVSLLTIQGRPGDADKAWSLDGLPTLAKACLDLRNQSWREMEAISCAWLRLQVAQGNYHAGKRFAHSLVSAAAKRCLRRTMMRGLALWILVERKADAHKAAEECLQRFLEMFVETDYSRPLVQDREICLPVLTGWIEKNVDSPQLEGALRLRRILNEAGEPDGAAPLMSDRELQVLQRLKDLRDEEIAAALDLSKAGVRYHIANIFGKLNVRGRRNAVRRAQEIGLLPDP